MWIRQSRPLEDGGWFSHLSANRFIRRPALFASGMGAVMVVALATQPRWIDVCTGINTNRGFPCEPMTLGLMTGYLMIALGVLTLIFGPIVNSMYRLVRYGQQWETSRVETAVGNVPLVIGIAYIVVGFVIAAIWT